jgi:hypothetical protein
MWILCWRSSIGGLGSLLGSSERTVEVSRSCLSFGVKLPAHQRRS